MHVSHRAAFFAVVVCALAVSPPQTFASFHLWKFDQVFSNASGSQQFIEMSTDADGQRFFHTDDGGTFGPAELISNSQTFIFPHDLADPATIGHDTAGQHLLIATGGFSPNGKTPDFTLPAGFLSVSAGLPKFTPNDPNTVLDSVAWSSLPTNGTDSLHQAPGTTDQSVSAASASNFTGATSDGGGGGGGGTAIPLPAGVYSGLAGLSLAAIVVRGRARLPLATQR